MNRITHAQAKAIITADAPGATTLRFDLSFTYNHVRRPIWPLDEDVTY